MPLLSRGDAVFLPDVHGVLLYLLLHSCALWQWEAADLVSS
jgi:hypothetical protein